MRSFVNISSMANFNNYNIHSLSEPFFIFVLNNF